MDFTVASLTTKPQFYANRVFFPSSYSTPCCELLRTNDTPLVYMVGQDGDIKSGQIALSAPQRNLCAVGIGSSIKVNPRKRDPKTEDAHSIQLIVESLDQERRVTIKEEELLRFFQAQFMDYPLNEGVPVFMDFNGSPVTLTPKTIKCPSVTPQHGVSFIFKKVGFITKETQISISAAASDKNRFFKLVEAEKPKQVFNSNWNFEQLGIGGLDKEAGVIFRRAFASRLLPPETVIKLGVKHVKGMLLYGPPGTGKTLIARKIGQILGSREPKIINGPEILNKYVGEAESNIRLQFADAIADYKENKENADLHVIIFDEIDSICKKRGSVRSGTGVHDTVVNQLLTMIDGIDSPNNILVIGMTNRKDLLDPALLRPGRLEVHVEISLPDEPGREQILRIHTTSLRENSSLAPDVDLKFLAKNTRNYAGGEIEGLVKAATSYAIARAIDMKKDKLEYDKNFKLQVEQQHFLHALEETVPAFGVDEDDLKALQGTIYPFPRFTQEYNSTFLAIKNDFHPITTVLIKGNLGAGKTAFASKLALELEYPYAKLIAPYHLLGMGEQEKVARIAEIFDEAFKSPQSVLIIDDIERIIEYTVVGPRFSNGTLQALIALLTRPHPHPDRKLTVILTTNKYAELAELGMQACFQFQVRLPSLTNTDVDIVAEAMHVDLKKFDPLFIAEHFTNVGVKRFTTILAIGQKYAKDQNVPLSTELLQSVVRHMPAVDDY